MTMLKGLTRRFLATAMKPSVASNSRAALKQFNFNGLHFWFS